MNQTYMHDGSIVTLEEVVEHYRVGSRAVTGGKNAGVRRHCVCHALTLTILT
ncbi:MAG: hypothetical protein HC852_18630 [Acaryochloridaceae cyanobacterium RU_4_10]|nr:hypothetical protein [Acaryochloridaceae cyanobacterium RU_4_10]